MNAYLFYIFETVLLILVVMAVWYAYHEATCLDSPGRAAAEDHEST